VVAAGVGLQDQFFDNRFTLPTVTGDRLWAGLVPPASSQAVQRVYKRALQRALNSCFSLPSHHGRDRRANMLQLIRDRDA